MIFLILVVFACYNLLFLYAIHRRDTQDMESGKTTRRKPMYLCRGSWENRFCVFQNASIIITCKRELFSYEMCMGVMMNS